MKKGLRIGLVLTLLLSLLACSTKPSEIKLNLGATVFKTIYNGPATNIADSKIGTLNSEESGSLKAVLLVNPWTVADLGSKTKTEPEFILEDNLGHLFAFYQETDYVLIEVSKEKMKSVYYKSELDLTTLKTDTLIPLVNGYQLKVAIKKFFYSTVIPDSSKYGCYSDLVLDKASSDVVKEVLEVDSWILINTKLTELGAYEMVLGFNSAVELYFHQSGSEATVAVSRNGDRSRFDVFRISSSVYDATKSSLTELRTALQPSPGSLMTEASFTKATFFVYPDYSENYQLVDLALKESDSAWALPYLNSESWIKLDSTLALEEGRQGLIVTNSVGTQATFGWASGCPVAVITKENDGQFREVYGLTLGFNGIIWAFSHSWTEAKPTSDILGISPNTVEILKGYSELGDTQYKTVMLTAEQSTTLMDVLNRDLWRKEPNPTQYAYGWDPLFMFEDTHGNVFRVFDDFMRNNTLIYVKGPVAGSNDTLFYLTSRQTVLDLKTTVDLLFPN